MSELGIWTSLRELGFTDAGAAGIMGNLQAESALSSINVEDRSGINDQVYTNEVDNGTRSAYQWSHDSYGYGLAQWTYYTRKENLLNYAKSKKTSIGDETMQIEFLAKELKSDYPSVDAVLRSTSSVADASYQMLMNFERPANASGQVSYRQSLSQKFYDKYAGKVVSVETKPVETIITEVVEAPIAYDESDELCNPRVPVLFKGEQSRAVYMAQCGLKDMNISLGVMGADGDFGSATEKAVKTLQEKYGLEQTGRIGESEWEILLGVKVKIDE